MIMALLGVPIHPSEAGGWSQLASSRIPSDVQGSKVGRPTGARLTTSCGSSQSKGAAGGELRPYIEDLYKAYAAMV